MLTVHAVQSEDGAPMDAVCKKQAALIMPRNSGIMAGIIPLMRFSRAEMKNEPEPKFLFERTGILKYLFFN